MSRGPRVIYPGFVYHVISRFVDRDWFITKDDERLHYLELFGRAISLTDWRCLAFAIMSNHIHLALIAGTHALGAWIRRVHSPFAIALNRAYDRIGSIFVRGPKSLIVEPHGVGSVIAYIHNNPVRAKVVGEASQSTWTSHQAYLGTAYRPRWLDAAEGLARTGVRGATEFDQWVADPARVAFDVMHEQRLADDVPPARPRVTTIDPNLLVTAVAAEFGITVTQLLSQRRTRTEVAAREAMVLCAQRCGISGVATAGALGISQQAVSLIGQRGVRITAVARGSRVLQRLESAGIVSLGL